MSGRIRTMKPEWLEDELLASASDEARVLSIALILMADDYGRGRASIASIAAGAWRYQMERDGGEHAPEVLARASRALRELVEIGFVTLYDVSRQRYFEIRNWSKHQKVDRPSKPRIPAPPVPESFEKNDTRETLASDSRDPRETLATDLRPPTTDQRPGPCTSGAREEGLDAEEVRSAYLARWEANPATRGKRPPLVARGPGAAVWIELAREAGDMASLVRLLDAAFLDDFCTGTGWTPGAIRGAAQRLLAAGPKAKRGGVAAPATHAQHAADVAERGAVFDGF